MRVSIPFVGPSYTLDNVKADRQRTINMYPQKVESGTGKAQWFLKSVHGLDEVTNETTANRVTFRGVVRSLNPARIYCVLGNSIYELSGTTLILKQTIALSGTPANLEAGRDHCVVCYAGSAYSINLTSGTVTAITDADLPSTPVWSAYLAGRYVYGFDGSGSDADQFYWSAIDDPTSVDALDFATAESAGDGLVRGITYRDELWLFGTESIEVWRASSNPDAAFERNTGVSISIGAQAAAAICRADNSLFFIGQDDNGRGVVYSITGYHPKRISTHAVEEVLNGAGADLGTSMAYTYQWNGHVFYCIFVNGLDTTLCYDATTGMWHDRAEFFNSDLSPSRIKGHAMKPDNTGTHYFFGDLDNHPTLSDRSVVYSASDALYTNDGDTLIRERTSPHYATPSFNEVFYSRLRLDCTVGTIVSGPKYVQLYYSNDGGDEYTASALQRSLGETGDRRQMVQWNRLGKARDRVWKIRCTDDVAFDIVNVDVQAEEGVS